MIKRPIIIRELQHGYNVFWRAYGINRQGKEFQLPDNRYEVLYPLDASTEKRLRTLCKRQYPEHIVKRRTS